MVTTTKNAVKECVVIVLYQLRNGGPLGLIEACSNGEWEWDGNGNEVIEMGWNWYEKSVPATYTYGSVCRCGTVSGVSSGLVLLRDDAQLFLRVDADAESDRGSRRVPDHACAPAERH